jgi:hypothetical protein
MKENWEKWDWEIGKLLCGSRLSYTCEPVSNGRQFPNSKISKPSTYLRRNFRK